ncbi:GTP-binding protein of the rab/ypt [Coemansia sp. RSA 2704]|nr:GTP-binding protein of the rab/ypt [Coemansia sp. RSA 2704]
MSEQQGQAAAAPKPTRVPYKFVLLGESAVGKSSLVTRLVRNTFNQYNESTIGAAFMTRDVELDESHTATLRIWDTAGQERYKSLAPMYYRNAEGAVVVYDITQEETFTKAKAWISELQRQNESRTVIALVGNKTDLADKRTVSQDEGARYAGEVGALFFEASAQSGQNVAKLFEELARKVPRPAPAAAASSGASPTVNMLASSGGAGASGAANDCAC